MTNSDPIAPCAANGYAEPFPKAARRALLLWMGIVCFSVVTLPVWGLIYQPPEPLMLADRSTTPAGQAPTPAPTAARQPMDKADVDKTMTTGSVNVAPASPQPALPDAGLDAGLDADLNAGLDADLNAGLDAGLLPALRGAVDFIDG